MFFNEAINFLVILRIRASPEFTHPERCWILMSRFHNKRLHKSQSFVITVIGQIRNDWNTGVNMALIHQFCLKIYNFGIMKTSCQKNPSNWDVNQFSRFFSPFVIFRYFFLLNSYPKLVGSPGNRIQYFLFVFESNKEISFLKGLESDLSLKSVNSRRYILD